MPAPVTCTTPGPQFVDVQAVNTGNAFAPGQTGQWWCDHHFAANAGGAWECISVGGSTCSADVPVQSDVTCGRLGANGSTPYCGSARAISGFGYGHVERVLVNQSVAGQTGQWSCDNHFGANLGGHWKCRSVSGGGACNTTVASQQLVSCSQYQDVQSVAVYAAGAGRDGAWWCTNHFGTNLGGTWDCLSVSPGSCAGNSAANAMVTCGRFSAVNEAPFAPVSCTHPSLDGAEREFCNYTEYMTTRTASSLYLYNDHVRAGINRSFGGTLFELYGTDKRNRIEEHGGSAVQLSMWGYDVNASGGAYFTTASCNSTPFSSPTDCQAANSNMACRVFPATGGQVSDCVNETGCVGWGAAAPWNPIMAQASNCGWNGPTNDVTSLTEFQGAVTLVKDSPYNFTKSTPFPSLTWRVTGNVPAIGPFVRLDYQVDYDATRALGAHNQEIPAIFTDTTLGRWFYFYGGDQPYADPNGPVTRLRQEFGTELRLPGRADPMPQPPPSTYSVATEEWMTVCDALEDQCLTVATFSPEVKTLVQAGQYVTPLGRLALGNSLHTSWRIYLFPYRFDDVVDGKSVRQWVHDLKNGG